MKESKEIVSFLKDKGFVYPGSDIYGGLANSWDYGPLGSMLKSNIRELWKKKFIDEEENIFHLDSSIILNSKVWEASGHVGKFNDPMVDCKDCKERFRADHIIEQNTDVSPANKSNKELGEIIKNINCPKCSKNNWTEVRDFQLMFKTNNSTTGSGDDVYLRPETAQGVFINFNNVVNTLNAKVPFGIGQVGKAFRNEVTPGNFIFRTKEFEQLELEYFTKPESSEQDFERYLVKIEEFLDEVGLSKENYRRLEVPEEDRAHYSSRTVDFEYNFPFGWGELLGLANRTNYDLSSHSEHSNESLEYHDQSTGEKYIPHIVETSFGLERILFAIVANNLVTEKTDDGERDILRLSYDLAPYKLAIAPLTNKLENESKELFRKLLKQDIGPIAYSQGGSIGKRYRKHDAIGTPFIATFDFDSLEDNSVTIRHRDSMKQDRVKIDDIKQYINNNAK